MTQTLQNTGDELRCSGKVSNSCSTNVTCHVTVKPHEHHVIWESCWIPVYLCISTNYNINKTCVHYKTYGSKDKPNIIYWIRII